MATPFDFVKTIDNKSEQLPISDYVPFVVNRALSHGRDTVLFANIMNMYPRLSSKMQYDFYFFAIPRKKRYNKWVKKDTSTDITIIKKYYKCSDDTAVEYTKILSPEQIKELSSRMDVGGRKKIIT